MKSYDDLQRFKEKTQTNHIEFKDMSEQTRNADNTNWAIIRQLMNEESALGNGQRIDIAAPQPVAADLFSKTNAEAAHAAAPAASTPASVAVFVAAKPVAQGGSLLDSISASLKPVAPPPERQPAPSVIGLQAGHPLDAPPLESRRPPLPKTTSSGVSLLDAVREQQGLVTEPLAVRPLGASSTPSAVTQETRFKQLFSASGARAADDKALPKETLLQPLLEKIALCR